MREMWPCQKVEAGEREGERKGGRKRGREGGPGRPKMVPDKGGQLSVF
jgi:hypothetical protein